MKNNALLYLFLRGGKNLKTTPSNSFFNSGSHVGLSQVSSGERQADGLDSSIAYNKVRLPN